MTKIKISICLLVISNIILLCGQDSTSNKYNVGFRYYTEYDTSRFYVHNQDTTFRPMLIHFWYPSKDVSDNGEMNFKQYIDLISIREDFVKPKDIIDQESYNYLNAYFQFAQNSYGIGKNISAQQILDAPVAASLNLSIEKDEFPLIIYAPSNSKSPIQNHIICEYLAGNGFYVISVPSAGLNSIERKDFENSVSAQVEDMEFIIFFIEAKQLINYSSIGLAGFSTGGLATTIFQMKHKNTKAVFCMDGSNEYSMYLKLSELKDFDIQKTEVPYFLVGNQDRPSIYPYYNSIRTKDKYYFRMNQLPHFGFVSFWKFFDNCNPSGSKHNFSYSYEFICESALTFFDAYLKENDSSIKKLSNIGERQSDFASNEKLDFSIALRLLNIFLSENIDAAITDYKNNKDKDIQNYDYDEEEISILGKMIIDYDPSAALKLFEFNMKEYPNSWHVYYDLSFIYKFNGKIDMAKKTLMTALEIDPKNKEVKELFKELD